MGGVRPKSLVWGPLGLIGVYRASGASRVYNRVYKVYRVYLQSLAFGCWVLGCRV